METKLLIKIRADSYYSWFLIYTWFLIVVPKIGKS